MIVLVKVVIVLVGLLCVGYIFDDLCNHGCATDIYHGIVFDKYFILVAQDVALIECAGETWCISQYELDCVFVFIVLHCYDTVGCVYAGICCDYGFVGRRAFHVSPYYVFAKMERDFLTFVKGIFKNNQFSIDRLRTGVFAAEFYLELFLTGRTNKNQHSV